MDLPAFSNFETVKPQAFFLGQDEEFAALADATITVLGGLKLRVHSHILSLHSRVLKSVVAAVHEGGAVVKDGISLKEPFTSFPLRPVGAFLRFMYQPEDACTHNFKQLGSDLCSVVRLAHQLDCPRLLSKLDAYLSQTVESATVKDAVAWASLAEDCKLSKLRVQAIRQTARALCSSPSDFFDDFSYGSPGRAGAEQAAASTSELKGLSRGSLLGVISTFVAASRRSNVSGCLPTADELLHALPRLENTL